MSGMACDHAKQEGPRRVRCSLLKIVGNVGVCSVCPHNTAKGVWPNMAAQVYVEVVVPPRQPADPLPAEQWPRVVKILAKLAKAGEAGAGDTTARIFGNAGGAFKVWFKRIFGKSCGCGDRQQWMNERFTYPS